MKYVFIAKLVCDDGKTRYLKKVYNPKKTAFVFTREDDQVVYELTKWLRYCLYKYSVENFYGEEVFRYFSSVKIEWRI